MGEMSGDGLGHDVEHIAVLLAAGFDHSERGFDKSAMGMARGTHRAHFLTCSELESGPPKRPFTRTTQLIN